MLLLLLLLLLLPLVGYRSTCYSVHNPEIGL